MYALITGASSGIGKEIARLLAKQGCNLILVARREQLLAKLKEELECKHAIKVRIKQCDLSKPQNCLELFEECRKFPIRIVINNAGFGKVGNFDSLSLEDELAMIQTNIIALHILTKLFVSHMKQGYILNVASIAAFQPSPMMATYGATKSYVANFSQAIRYEMKKQKKDIHIATLCPGPVNTEFSQVAGAAFNLRSITAKECARQAIQGMFSKKYLIIPSFPIKLLHFFSKITPNIILLPIEYMIQTSKTKHTSI